MLSHKEMKWLRDFVESFNKEAVQVDNLDVIIAIKALAVGITCKPLYDSLTLLPPSTFPELMARALQHIRLKESTIADDNKPDRRKPTTPLPKGLEKEERSYDQRGKEYEFEPWRRDGDESRIDRSPRRHKFRVNPYP